MLVLASPMALTFSPVHFPPGGKRTAAAEGVVMALGIGASGAGAGL
jgi:hypothetical protein